MNLAATLEMFFGGPGSGCRGPNCGRKPSLSVKLPWRPGSQFSESKYNLYDAVKHREYKGYFGHVEQTRGMPAQVPHEQPKSAQYQKGLPTTVKTTGTKWMEREHPFKNYFHTTSKGVNLLTNSHTTLLEGPGKEGGTVVSVTHQSKTLGAPVDRLRVKEHDTDEYGNVWRTRSREYVRVQDGLNQVKARYGVKL